MHNESLHLALYDSTKLLEQHTPVIHVVGLEDVTDTIDFEIKSI
jgi:hypothetical protein